MKVIAFAAVSGGGKTALVRSLKRRLERAEALFFDDYTFPGEPEDFYQWAKAGADYSVWDLSPLKADILRVRSQGVCGCLLLDYPFGYCHPEIRKLIDCAVFIDTPLDIAMVRRVLRDRREASGGQIRADMEHYLKYGRISYLQMLRDVLPGCDVILDGAMDLEALTEEAARIAGPL